MLHPPLSHTRSLVVDALLSNPIAGLSAATDRRQYSALVLLIRQTPLEGRLDMNTLHVQTRPLQAATNTTTTADQGTTKHGIPSAVLAIIIPFAVIIAGAIIGLAIYFLTRRRRLRRKAQRGRGHTPNGSVRIGPAMEEGLNELGEAPPPYVPGGGVKERPDREEVEEVWDEPTAAPPAYIPTMDMAGARGDT